MIFVLAETKLHFVQGKLHERLYRLSTLLAISAPCFTHYFKAIIQGSTVALRRVAKLEKRISVRTDFLESIKELARFHVPL